MKRLFLIISILNSLTVLSQIPIDSVSFKNDLLIYRQALETTHPSLYRFTKKEKIDSLFNHVDRNLNDSSTLFDFFNSLSKISSQIREEHSYILDPKRLLTEVRKKSLFPFRVFVQNNQLILKNSREESLNYLNGAIVTSINGRSIQSILRTLLKSNSSVSGDNVSSLKSELSIAENFSFAYYYFIDTTSVFTIDYGFSPNDDIKTITINGSNKGLSKSLHRKYPSLSDEPFSLEIDEKKSLAILTIHTFANWRVDKKVKDYTSFFKHSFKRIHENDIKNLVIDVRDNTGGDEMIGGDLLTYLIDYEFPMYRYIKAKTLNFDFTNSLHKSLPKPYKIRVKENNYISTDSGYIMKKNFFIKTYAPKKRNFFNGNVYALSNGMSYSASTIFLSLFKYHKVGKIVGQESGGTSEDLDGRARISFYLPYSNIYVTYPIWGMKLAVSGENRLRGVFPDYSVPLLLSDKDEEMDIVLKLIESKE